MKFPSSWVRSLLIVCFVLIIPAVVCASNEDLNQEQANIVIQLAVLLFMVRLGNTAAQKLHLPSVLGELLAGVVIGPYALGKIALPGFPHGLFPLIPDAAIPVSTELYTFSTVASIVLLFMSGLETDIGMFLKYSITGTIVGLGGIIFAFAGGAVLGMIMNGKSIMDPQNLFLGIMGTATSVGITARILSEKKKMDSPEGVTILAAAVFDDVFGIILLAVVVGIASLSQKSAGAGIDWGKIGLIALRAFGIWLIITLLGIIFSKKLAKLLKRFKSISIFSILALGLALLLGGFFEKEGLAMIIGAYIVGLSLSNTDISHVIEERLHIIYEFIVPLFFAVMGMILDVSIFLKPEVLIGGFIFSVVAILTKIVGCSVPSLFTGFTPMGALRVGVGMVPRGEVALIIAGIGASSGILSNELFGMAIMMTFITTIAAPALLNKLLAIPKKSLKKEAEDTTSNELVYTFPSEEVAVLIAENISRQLEESHYFVRFFDVDNEIAQARKENITFSFYVKNENLIFEAKQSILHLVNTIVVEAVANLTEHLQKIKKDFNPQTFIYHTDTTAAPEVYTETEFPACDTHCVIMNMKPKPKQEIIYELVDLLYKNNKIKDREAVYHAVLDRENSMTTGLQDGIAIPHAKTDAIDTLCAAVGIVPEGTDFNSLDGKPAQIIILSVAPKSDPGSHLEFLSSISSVLQKEKNRKRLLAAQYPKDILDILTGNS
ncbi:MAG TPA: cation:proton antiporter [Spirochaetia bacterium]|nr:cation:proton antiporter [Spirochaetales bacterium]HPD80099.1 cation:proton antiporter [Spirochaetales bacterium]HQG39546.1 cation:proton antiporter [Spirochaetales bacterium]HRS66164.1 cation:proton antiporter [Spirochaetia bacterium]